MALPVDGLRVSVPASLRIWLSAVRVIRLVRVLLPAVLRMAPVAPLPLSKPLPATVIASAMAMLPESHNAAPLAMVVVPAEVPNALLWLMASTPAFTFVAPV